MTLFRRPFFAFLPYLIALAVIVASVLVIMAANPRTSQTWVDMSMPTVLKDANAMGADIRYAPGLPTTYRIESMHCLFPHIAINNTLIPLSTATSCNRADVDLSGLLKPGDNRVLLWPGEAKADTRGDFVFLSIEPFYFGNSTVSTLACIALLLATLYIPARRLWTDTREGSGLLLFLAGALASLAYVYANDIILHTNDITGHARYIHAAAEDGLAGAFGYRGGESWHPPFYYYAMGLAKRLAWQIGVFSPDTVLRFVSFCFYLAFLMYGLRTARRWVSGPAFVLAAAMIAFWPSALVRSVTINNDLCLSAASAAFLYYISCWWQTQDRDAFVKAAISLCIALVIKSSAYALLLAFAVVVVTRWVVSGRTLPTRTQWWIALLVIAVGMAGNMARPLYGIAAGQERVMKLHLGGQANWTPTAERLLSLDLPALLQEPQVNWRETGIPQFLAKTAVFSEWNNWRMTPTAGLLPVGFALLLIAAALYLLLLSRERLLERAPLAAAFFAYLLALYGFYILKQWRVCADFRFIYPMVILIAVAIADWCRSEWYRQRPLAALTIAAFAGGFVLLSGWQYANHLRILLTARLSAF